MQYYSFFKCHFVCVVAILSILNMPLPSEIRHRWQSGRIFRSNEYSGIFQKLWRMTLRIRLLLSRDIYRVKKYLGLKLKQFNLSS